MRKVFLEFYILNICLVRDLKSSNFYLCDSKDLLLAYPDDDKTYFLPSLKIKNEFRYFELAFEKLVLISKDVL